MLDIGTLISKLRALKAPEQKLAGHDNESFKGARAVMLQTTSRGPEVRRHLGDTPELWLCVVGCVH